MPRPRARARWTGALALACLCSPGSAQWFASETLARVKKESFCAAPTHLPASDGFEFVQHSRNLSLLERAQAAAPEVWNETFMEVVRRVYAHPTLLSQAEVQAGISNAGHERMERFVRKLVEGKPVTVVVLGGSISFGHGVMTFENSWPSRVFRYIEQTFPHKEHRLLNKAIPATTSSFVTPCAYTMIPEGTDLVMAEFTVNDGADDATRTLIARSRNKPGCTNDMEGQGRQSMERLVRHILGGPSKPALLYVHTWAGARQGVIFYEGVEDRYTTLMAYYGVATLSLRNALHGVVQRSAGLKARVWPHERDIHLTCIGTKFLADLVTGYLGERAVDSAARLHGLQREPEPLSLADEQRWELPPPMFAGNEGNYSTDCILGERMQGLVTNAQGFQWLNEGTPTDPKWGYVAATPGSQMAIKVPLANVTHNGTDMLVGLGFLLSYGPMGVAQVGCLAGCACPVREYSTHLKQAGWSMTFWRFLDVKVVPGSQECTVGVVVAPRTHGGGHKVKISSVMATGELGTKFGGNSLIDSAVVDLPGANPVAADRRRSMAEVPAEAQVDLDGISVGTRPPQRLNLANLRAHNAVLSSLV